MTFDVKRAKEDGAVIYNGRVCRYVGFIPEEYSPDGEGVLVCESQCLVHYPHISNEALCNIPKKEKAAPYRRYFWRNGNKVEVDCVRKSSFGVYTDLKKGLQNIEAAQNFIKWKDLDWVEEEIEV